jgi:hypothetical protein
MNHEHFGFIYKNKPIHHHKRVLLMFKYPKILVFFFCVIVATFLFNFEVSASLLDYVASFTYVGAFIGGLFFSLGFTSPFAAALFIKLNPQNFLLALFLGALGGMLSDMFIFKFIKFSMNKEFDRLKKEPTLLFWEKKIDKTLKPKLSHYLMFTLAGFLISSPIPDEAGIAILEATTKINPKKLALISFLCHAVGIGTLLLL